jgi:hydroxyethylthiazole kinase
MFKKCFEAVRDTVPLIHNITNYVTVNDVANALLACGASPIMSDDEQEVEEITSICKGLNINIGTLNQNTIPSMFLAGKKANELSRKVLLDPVGAGASRLRTQTSLKLIEQIKFDVVRGNISEIKAISGTKSNTQGVDACVLDEVTAENLGDAVDFMKKFAQRLGCVVVATGKYDLVADESKCYVIQNGLAQMEKITGTGCQQSAIITAFISANPNCVLEATAAAVCLMGLAGEIAYKQLLPTDGNATYRNKIIDTIYNMSAEDLEKGAKYEIK